MAIFGGVLDQIAEHLVEVLPLDPDLRVLVADDVDRDVGVEGRHRPLDRLDAVPHGRPGLGRGAAADRPGAGEVVVDLAPHHRGLADHRIVEVGANGRWRHW